MRYDRALLLILVKVLDSVSQYRFLLVQRVIETLLNRVAARIFPAVLVSVALVVLLWQMGHAIPTEGEPVAMRVWEQTTETDALDPVNVQAHVQSSPSALSYETRRSTRAHWIGVEGVAPNGESPLFVEFPSRHMSRLTCWDSRNGQWLGAAKRGEFQGVMVKSRGGFGLVLPGQSAFSLICQAEFRGPAKISVLVTTQAMHVDEQESYLKTGAMIEAGIGILATFMLITAIVNRSKLYWTFVGWLLLNMRMASLSAGTDFALFGWEVPAGFLVEMRQWTVCMYFAMTVAMFSLLFRKELQAMRAGWPLTGLQSISVLFIAICPFVPFESMLMVLWYGTAAGVVLILSYLYQIMRAHQSRMAYWYAASIAVTLIASLSEVVAAATGQRGMLAGLNSVTAALASALLASAALAEHMRADRLQKIEAQRTLKAAYEDSPIGLFTVNAGDVISKANPAFQRMLQSLDAVQTTRLSQIFEERIVRELVALSASGLAGSIDLQTKVHNSISNTEHWFAIKASTVDGSIIEGSLQDITDRVVATDRLEFLANHDPLTECLNLRGITRYFGRAMRRPTALAYFDLDRFKVINDLYGHTAGDRVLIQVCARIQGELGPKDKLSRVGGDEFLLAFADADMEHATKTCRAIAQAISAKSYKIDRQSFALSISGGLVGTEQFGKAPFKEIISAADTLCRLAKKRATDRIVVMESDDRFFRHHKEELEVISSLERGEAPEGLFLVMQPEISLTHPFDSLNFEVLIRLRKSDGSVVPAGIIIEAAETHGKSAIIDRWVMTTAIAWIEAHRDSLPNTRFVSINLSGGSLNDEAFTEELFVLFSQHLDALSMICLEITETVALTDMQNMQRFIDRVRSMGAKVALDDFGAGYSSFGYLRGLSVDALKLDGSLVKDAVHSPAGLAIIDAIGTLVGNLGMKSIGEFAEDLATIKALANAGIDYAQGYGISKPVMPERILACRSGADFIEDPEILEFVKQLQAKQDSTLPLFASGINVIEVSVH